MQWADEEYLDVPLKCLESFNCVIEQVEKRMWNKDENNLHLQENSICICLFQFWSFLQEIHQNSSFCVFPSVLFLRTAAAVIAVLSVIPGEQAVGVQVFGKVQCGRQLQTIFLFFFLASWILLFPYE